MASTTVFAPSVRAVQPAFQWGKDYCYVFFTLNYNKLEEIKRIKYTVIDPNKSSIDGANSMIDTADRVIVLDFDPEGEYGKDTTGYIAETGECFFRNNDQLSNYKTLTVNQFYQVQIYLSDKTEDSNPAVADDWSLPSTVSLIRPIPEVSEDDEKSFISIDGQKLTGQIEYNDESSIETIASYQYNIINTKGTSATSDDEIVYSSPRITNFLGLRFKTIIPYSFAEDQAYKIELTYTTKHGYTPAGSLTKNIGAKTWGSGSFGTLVSKYPKINIADGAIDFKFNNINTTCRLQRASEYTDYKIWSDVANLTSSDTNKIIQDILLEGKGRYQYRLVKKKEGEEIQDSKQDLNTIEMHYDDIFLSDKDYMFALRYNPKISSFKWVTQDSITNTLGGKYPLVRRNGDQFYKQFGISGTLYLDWPEATTGSCSIILENGKPMSMETFFVEESCSLYLSEGKATEYNQATLKKKMRDIIAEFLSNGSIKLLRSEEEGLMLVYLSGVSFTPNTTSGRRIYDFSATATEICEATEENIAKYLPTRTGASNYFINASKVE